MTVFEPEPRSTLQILLVTLAGFAILFGGGASAQQRGIAFQDHQGPIRSIAVLTDGVGIATGGFDSAISVRDLRTGRILRVLHFHESAVTALIALPGGCFASGGDDAQIALWCGEDPAPRQVLRGHQGPISTLAEGLVSASWDRQVRLWSGEATQSTIDHPSPVTGLSWLETGTRLVTASYDGHVRVTQAATSGSPSRILHQTELPAAINALAIGIGKIHAASVDGHVRILGSDLGLEGAVDLADGPLTALALSADGRTAVVAGIRTPPTVIDVATRTVVRRLPAVGLPIWSVAISPDGKDVFSGGSDGILRRWTTATGEAVGRVSASSTDTLTQTDDHPGARVFRACRVCHAITPDSGQRAGPTLHGVMGRRIATAPGYAYSQALRKMDIVWSAETIARLFEIGPAAMTPGAKMPEQRITDPADRKALVDWLARVTQP